MIEKYLNRFLKHHDIVKNNELYLRRWFILSSKRGNIYLHKIIKSDDDKDPHDHPWRFISFIIKNGYFEEIYDAARRLSKVIKAKPFRCYYRGHSHVHRVIIKQDKPAWTLLITGAYKQQWGFVTPQGKIFWRQYLNYWGPDNCDPSQNE